MSPTPLVAPGDTGPVSTPVARSAQPSRVLVVAPQPFFLDRGTPIAVRHVIESLSELGHQVDVLTFPMGDSPEVPNVRYLRVPNWLGLRRVPIGFSLRKVWLDLFLWQALRRAVRSGAYAVVHAVEESAFFALLATRPLGIPLVYDMQSSIPEQLRSHWLLGRWPADRVSARCERWLLRGADRVACSAGLEGHVRSVARDAWVLRWTFPGTYRDGTPSQRDPLRAELGIGADQPVVLYTGNFAPYQGVPELVQAIGPVRRVHPDAVFVLVGASAEDEPAIARRMAAELAPDAYRLVPRQPVWRMPLYLATADVAVSPRRNGSNLPLKVLEYLAGGRAIVATRIPAHTALLDDELAVLVDPCSRGIAQGIIGLLDDPARRARHQEAARRYAAEHLGREAFLLSVAHLFEGLTPRPAAG